MLNWYKLSLRSKFIVLFILTQILAFMLLFFYLNYQKRAFYLNELEYNLAHHARLLLVNDKLNLEPDSLLMLDNWVQEIGQEIETRISIVNVEGVVLADSDYLAQEMENHSTREEIMSVLQGEKKATAIRKSETLAMDMFYYATGIKNDEQLIGVIRLAKSLSSINSVLRNNIKNYIVFFIFLIMITMVLILKFSSYIIQPLNKITKVVSSLARGKYKQRVKLVNYDNELGSLARMFNFMAQQLEDKITELSEEKKRAHAILTGMVNGLIATDENKKIRIINPAARDMFNISRKDVINKNLIEVISNYQIDDFLDETLNNNLILSEEIILEKEDKKIFRCNFAPITNELNKVTGGIIVFNEITRLRKLEQIRTDFVANVSHELRTPLTSIIGYVDTLLETKIEEERTWKKFLGIIKQEADRLALLIKDLLNLSRFESSNYLANRQAVDLEELIIKCQEMLAVKAREKNIKIKLEIANQLPLVKVVVEQIEIALSNLLDNAIKYTPKGGQVIIRAYLNKNKVNKLVVEVEDSGIGISKKDQQRIFERFYRVERARSRDLGGTGIGLALVKHIIKNHDSDITVKSKLGQGTLFAFMLDIV